MQRQPILSIARAARDTGLSVPMVTSALGHLQQLGIVRELTDKQRGRLFGYADYLAMLNERTEG